MADETETPPAPAETAPEAPFGTRTDGAPNRRDPNLLASLRGRRTARPRAAAKKAAAPVDRPASARKAKPDYAKRIVELSKAVLPMVPDPVDRQILRQSIPPWAVALEKAAAESPALAAILDRMLLGNVFGGAWLELGTATLEIVGLIALNHGMAPHPMVAVMLGAKLQALQLAAVEEQRAVEEQAAQLRRLMDDVEAEHAEAA